MRYLIARIAATCLIVVGFSLPVFGVEEVTHGGKTYGIVEGGAWNDAEQKAQLYGGHLATIDNATMNSWLQGRLSTLSVDRAWIGLNYDGPVNGDSYYPDWTWSGTGASLSPLFGMQNFAAGCPRPGTGTDYSDYSDRDYAFMETSNGTWRDYYKAHETPDWGNTPSLGIYEVAHTSVVPITMNLPVRAIAYAVGMEDSQSGTNSTAALAWYQVPVWNPGPDPENPQEGEWWSYNDVGASAKIDCSGGTWGGRIETALRVMDPSYSYGLGDAAVDLNESSGTISIGTAADIPAGTLLKLMVDANTLWNSYDNTQGDSSDWSFILKQGSATLLSMDENAAGEQALWVHAGDVLSVEFSNSLGEGWGDRNSDLAVNMWVVPEPGTLSLLTIAGLCGIGYAWLRRSNRQQHC